jgi:hypothetical protein
MKPAEAVHATRGADEDQVRELTHATSRTSPTATSSICSR